MKEKDLERNIDNLIIDGLIKEAEQDNADFEAAIRNMSDEEFEGLIYEPADAHVLNDMKLCACSENAFYGGTFDDSGAEDSGAEDSGAEDNVFETAAESKVPDMCYSKIPLSPYLPFVAKKSRWQVFRPWITSAVSAAAVVLIVLIPSINAMNGKLCDSALYASTAYITSSRSANEINGLSDDQLKAKLPELEKRYVDCIKEYGKLTYYTDDLKESGWDLTLAYLRLHKKGDAVKVLKVLTAQFNRTPFGDHCQKMLDQL